MKKVISILALLALITSEFVSANFYSAKTVPEIIETEELPHVLTDAELSKLYICKPDVRKKDTNIVEVNYEDARLLLCVSRAEGGCGLEGQSWCMRAILNRVLDNNFPNTVYDVISEDGQFEVFTTGAYIVADVNTNTHLALARIESGWDNTQGALYWESITNSSESWHKKNLEYIATVDGNIFYK